MSSGSTWPQKLSGSLVLLVLAVACLVVSFFTGFIMIRDIGFLLVLVVMLMSLYALCCTTRLSRGSIVVPVGRVSGSGPGGTTTTTTTTVVHVLPASVYAQSPPAHQQPAYNPQQSATLAAVHGTVAGPMRPAEPGFHPTFTAGAAPGLDQPPPYSAVVKMPPPPASLAGAAPR